MNKEQLEEKSLGDLREIAKLQGVKSLTKYRKNELVEIIMAGGVVPSDSSSPEGGGEPQTEAFAQQPAAQEAMPGEPGADLSGARLDA